MANFVEFKPEAHLSEEKCTLELNMSWTPVKKGWLIPGQGELKE